MKSFAQASSASRSKKITGALSGIAMLGATALILSGCSSPAPSASGSGGLALKIGTVLPQTGTLSQLGPPEIVAVNLATAEINAANAGLTLSVTQKDSGDTSTNIATQSVTALLQAKVGAIIGAASSGVSLSVIDQITKAGVVQFSPANTAPELSTYADDGYYFRDAPSDLLQGKVLAQKVLKDGKTKPAILFQNDDYGNGLNKSLKDTFMQNGITLAAEQSFDPTATNFASEVSSVLASKPDSLIIISYAQQFAPITQSLETAGFNFADLYGTDGNFGTPDLPVNIAGAQFTSPGVQSKSDFKDKLQAQAKKDGMPAVKVYSYAPEAYDATILIALAALQGKGVDGKTIRDNLKSVSEVGTKCITFVDCAKLIKAGTDINYDGLSGPITFDDNGDASQAYISIYKNTSATESVYVDSQFGDLSKK